MKLKKVLAMLMTTATVMSMTVGNVSFAAGTDMPTAVQQGGEESKKTEALNEQEETSQEVQESTERGGKEEDSKNESEEVAQEKNSAREDATDSGIKRRGRNRRTGSQNGLSEHSKWIRW